MKIFHFAELIPQAREKIKLYLDNRIQYQPSITSCNDSHNERITQVIKNNVKLFYNCHSNEDIELCLDFAAKLIDSGFCIIKHLDYDRLILSYHPEELFIPLPNIEMMREKEKDPPRLDRRKIIAERESLELEVIHLKKRIDNLNAKLY